MNYGLPTSVEVNGKTYDIRSDYRAVLDIIAALTDPDLDDTNKALETLDIFYPAFSDIPEEDYQEALAQAFKFIDLDDDPVTHKQSPQVMSWEQDFRYIVNPVNRVLGKEIRSVDYLHWWTFVGAYMEIGDCFFAQVVSIRDKKARGKKLDKTEQEFYKRNREAIDIKQNYSQAESELLKAWGA